MTKMSLLFYFVSYFKDSGQEMVKTAITTQGDIFIIIRENRKHFPNLNRP